jgi:hypothetical protein
MKGEGISEEVEVSLESGGEGEEEEGVLYDTVPVRDWVQSLQSRESLLDRQQGGFLRRLARIRSSRW